MARGSPSFTAEVKAELANLQPAKICCQHAELGAIVGPLAESTKGGLLTVRVPRNAVARKIVQLARATGGTVEEISKGSTSKRPNYRLRLNLRPSLASSDICCARAAIRGTFLARGIIGEPSNAYHLEIGLRSGGDRTLHHSLQRLELPMRTMVRRGQSIYYLKGAEGIAKVLGLIGANRAVMRFENGRIVREMRSQANRRVNSETANLDKRLRSALRQVHAIKRLRQKDPQLAGLSPALRETAEMRLAHPRAGLQSLAERAHLSKSAIAHRLRRLTEQATSHSH
jgi:DNA-binding protein WhiA